MPLMEIINGSWKYVIQSSSFRPKNVKILRSKVKFLNDFMTENPYLRPYIVQSY